jgi:signal transduction histidine kinase
MSQIYLTLNVPLALTAILVNFVFVILVLVRSSRTLVHITFLFICVSVVVWNFGELIRHFTGKQMWSNISLIGSAMIPTLMFHFVITQVKPEQKSSVWIVPAYTFSFLLALSSVLALLYPGIQRFVYGAMWDICYFIFFTPFYLGLIVMLTNAIKKAKSEDEKSRFRYMLLAGIIGVFTVITDHVQTLKVPVPPLGHLGSVFYSSILAIGLFKHRTAYDILAQMRMKLDVLSETAASIAHEIRNPLGSIKGAASLLSKELKNLGDLKSQEYAAIIAEEIERINNILTNFQYFTRPIKIEKEPVSINEVIQKTVKLAESDTLNMKIWLDLSRNLPLVQADAMPLKQVFLNLIKNAAEACEQDGELVIKTEYSAPWVKIRFTDNGRGIPPELLDRIFEPFFTTKTTGMGVGLAICQRIIQAHGGRIEVKNMLPKGTQFSIFFTPLRW